MEIVMDITTWNYKYKDMWAGRNEQQEHYQIPG